MRLQKRKMVSLLMATMVLFACVSPMHVFADETAPATLDAATGADTLALPNYYDYQKAITFSQADKAISLSIDQAVLSSDDAALVEYLDKQAIRLSPADWAEWTVKIPADATYVISLD